MRVVVDAARCTGHGRCYDLAPAIFDADDAGHSVVRVDDLAESQRAEARRAVATCPEGAITLVD